MRVATKLLCVIGLTLGTAHAAGRKELSREGWAGLAFRDVPGGYVVVSWIFPGPLKGKGLTCEGADLARPDLLVALNGEAPSSAKEAEGKIRRMAPGETLHLDVRTSKQRGGAIPDTLDHQDDMRRVDVVLADRAEWAGTIGMTPSTGVAWAPEGAKRLLDPGDASNLLGEAVAKEELGPEVAKLRGVFGKWLADNPDAHSLAHVRAAFDDPFRLPEIARDVSAPAAGVAGDPLGTAVRLVRNALDVPTRRPPAAHRSPGRKNPGFGDPSAPSPERRAAKPKEPKSRLADVLRDVGEHVDLALGDVAADTTLAQEVLTLLRVPRKTFYLEGDETREHVAVMRRSMDVDFGELVLALAAFQPLVSAGPSLLEDVSNTPDHAGPPPDELAGAVEGNVRWTFHAEGVGWIVVGADGNNRYDVSKIAGVLDPAGDDEYFMSGLATGARAIVDLAGNDKYTGFADQGPASALLGAALIDDRGGDDRYEGSMLSTGAAAFGAALLLDRGGIDAYVGSEWSIGAAMYGAAVLIDLGGGGDSYLGEFLCEGVGGPRGFGAIVDEGGNDLYRANGPTPSAYGTGAVYQSLSQGFGFGFRQYAAGGIGLLCDQAGDDRYEAGEFAQGGAYYWALGLLHDVSGRDLYYGNRYGQGFGVHQAVGALIDDAGDDNYWSMTAASQGSGWDIGCGLLLDAAGNDHYRCDDLGQGAAAQQAIGLSIDLGGDDARDATGEAVQGAAGTNEYHWAETGAGSLGVLIDLGGGEDRYVAGRSNGVTAVSRGEEDSAKRSGASTVFGVFVDR